MQREGRKLTAKNAKSAKKEMQKMEKSSFASGCFVPIAQ